MKVTTVGAALVAGMAQATLSGQWNGNYQGGLYNPGSRYEFGSLRAPYGYDSQYNRPDRGYLGGASAQSRAPYGGYGAGARYAGYSRPASGGYGGYDRANNNYRPYDNRRNENFGIQSQA